MVFALIRRATIIELQDAEPHDLQVCSTAPRLLLVHLFKPNIDII
jgi:hypothetical protein